MMNKYIVTIVCDETTQHFIIKSLLSKNELYDEFCKLYDKFDDIIISTCTLKFDFVYMLTCNNDLIKSLHIVDKKIIEKTM